MNNPAPTQYDINDKGALWVKKDADHSKCCASSGICDATTFGQGECDHHGYWEIPCYYCARSFEKSHPQFGQCWPYSREVLKEYEAIKAREDGEWDNEALMEHGHLSPICSEDIERIKGK